MAEKKISGYDKIKKDADSREKTIPDEYENIENPEDSRKYKKL